MRRPALIAFGLALALGTAAPAQAMIGARPASAAATPIVKVGYYCSPGFIASYGRCIATASTDEVDLYLNEPGGYVHDEAPPPVLHRRHHRHGLHARY